MGKRRKYGVMEFGKASLACPLALKIFHPLVSLYLSSVARSQPGNSKVFA